MIQKLKQINHQRNANLVADTRQNVIQKIHQPLLVNSLAGKRNKSADFFLQTA
jgi:hypothetical protein